MNFDSVILRNTNEYEYTNEERYMLMNFIIVILRNTNPYEYTNEEAMRINPRC
jgi:hypothetical protein